MLGSRLKYRGDAGPLSHQVDAGSATVRSTLVKSVKGGGKTYHCDSRKLTIDPPTWPTLPPPFTPRPRRRGWTEVSRITASTSAVRAPACRWGFESRLPHRFNEARTPGSRQGDSCFAHSWALAMAEVARRRVATLAPEPARAQVADHGEGFPPAGRTGPPRRTNR